jgi:6-pyruvoyltetrahydropterin/6-carboxytetrahydropterin synthase
MSKQFRFEAAHSLPQLPDGHKCKRTHGHSYVVEIVLSHQSLDDRGFMAGIDYADLNLLRDMLDQDFDHRNLDDVLGAENTTSERIARFLFGWCKAQWAATEKIGVSETSGTWVWFGES